MYAWRQPKDSMTSLQPRRRARLCTLSAQLARSRQYDQVAAPPHRQTPVLPVEGPPEMNTLGPGNEVPKNASYRRCTCSSLPGHLSRSAGMADEQ